MSVKSTHDYGVFARLFDYLNDNLFEGKLDTPVLTLTRKKGVRGYFWNSAFKGRNNSAGHHEISMNPDTFSGLSDTDIFSTYLHEMCHLWHQMFGNPGKNGYHTKEWANKMLEVGLKPISYDQPGKMTGYKVDHQIIPGGKFEKLIAEFVANPENQLQFESRYVRKYASTNKKHKRGTKYTCGCSTVTINKNMLFAAKCLMCGNDFKVVS